jgi:hypothetical protein
MDNICKWKVISCLSILLICFSCGEKYDSSQKQGLNTCDSQKLLILNKLTALSAIKLERNNLAENEQNRKQVHEIIRQLDNPKDIATLARMSRALAIQDRDSNCVVDSKLLVVYEETFWHCVKILSANKTEENIRQLERLKETSSLQGADAGYFDSIIEGKPFP